MGRSQEIFPWHVSRGIHRGSQPQNVLACWLFVVEQILSDLGHTLWGQANNAPRAVTSCSGPFRQCKDSKVRDCGT